MADDSTTNVAFVAFRECLRTLFVQVASEYVGQLRCLWAVLGPFGAQLAIFWPEGSFGRSQLGKNCTERVIIPVYVPMSSCTFRGARCFHRLSNTVQPNDKARRSACFFEVGVLVAVSVQVALGRNESIPKQHVQG